jgi:FtsH-binding integral membrane protein
VIFGFSLGVWFSGAMVLLASGSVLYNTSNIIKYYDEEQYVSAALSLFASIALLFWYILRLLIQLSSSD